MPPPLLIDLATLDLTRTALAKHQIYNLLPHRHEFQLLDGVCMYDVPAERIVTYVEVKPDDWWVRAHVEGRPLLPGVLMLEMAAQTSAVLAKLAGNDAFMGFGGVERCKFREMVVPPARLYILCTGVNYRARRIVSDAQGVVDGRLVFEAQITGLTIR
ncbi:MAG: 3-hydroxyacyl-ACP dehydratase FabZ family protein [Phycisphaerales bacterium]|nr:3-hydroxyacyl-ACP dehydratase FabZ family protein [Phycisphaerales bacterium]